MSKNKSNKSQNVPGKGHNKPPKPLATAAQCGAAITAEADAADKSKTTTGNRYRVFLMATTSDPDLADLMSAHYKASLAPANQTAEIRERVTNAKNKLFTLFNVPVIPEKPEDDVKAKARRELMQRNALDSIRLCDAVHAGGHDKSIIFDKNGGTFINYATPLGPFMWTKLEWTDHEIYKKRPDAERNIGLVDSAWYMEKGRSITWSDFAMHVCGPKRVGQAAKPKRVAVSSANVSNGLQEVANMYATNAPKVSEIAAIRGTLENVRRIVAATLGPIPNVKEVMNAVLADMDKAIASFADPNKTVKTAAPNKGEPANAQAS